MTSSNNSNSEDYWFEYVLELDPNVIKKLIHEEFITSLDKQIHLDIYGKDEPNLKVTIIFIHGTAVYSKFYAEFLYNLYKEGYRIVAVDLPGHGMSEGRRGHFSMEELTAVVSDVVTYMIDIFGDNIAVMGSSLGGFTSLYAVAADERIKAGICHNAAILNEGAHKKIVKVGLGYKILKPFVPIFAKLIPTLRISVWAYLDAEHLFQDEALVEKMEIVMNDKLISDRYTLKSIATQMRAPLARPIEEIETPIMILNSNHDVLFSVEYMQEIFDRLKNSRNKKLEIIENAAHLILHERPDECLKRIIPWLNQIFQ